MEDLLLKLLAHNPTTRGVAREDLESTGLRGDPSAISVVSTATALLSTISGRGEAAIARELAEVFSYRLLFLLLPEQCLFGDPARDKPVIAAHLKSLGVEPTEAILRGLKFFVDNFRAKTRSEVNKMSITDVYVRYPRIYDSILQAQNGRCAVCGLSLLYGVNMQLDHVLPWHLGDDPSDGSNWQFLCEKCNRGKGMFPHYSLSPLLANWIRPNTEHALGEDARYAALKRDGRCSITGRGPKEVELTVQKNAPSGCWVLDNLTVVAVDPM